MNSLERTKTTNCFCRPQFGGNCCRTGTLNDEIVGISPRNDSLKALLTAKLHQTNNPDIYPSIIGCVFLGTPFRGTKSQSKASVLAKLAEHIGVGKNSGLLKLLEEDSEALRDLLHDFSTLASESHMLTSCFFEQHESDLVKLKVSLVSQKVWGRRSCAFLSTWLTQ